MVVADVVSCLRYRFKRSHIGVEDYEDLFDWEEADVMPLTPQIEDHIQRVMKLINSFGK